MRILLKDIPNHVGLKVLLKGWVSVRRDHGKLIFIDLRDVSGTAQVVCLPSENEAYQIANELRAEWVISLEGEIKERPENMKNDKEPLGAFEVVAKNIEILNKSLTPVFDISTDGYDVNEETRMEYRYLDLRRERLLKNLKNRSRLNAFIRNYLIERDFIEIETPILTKSTPEGARDYLVPSRLYNGNFYALPQSPQQYKQLLMSSGVEKYFQIARCFRDEDTRGDRQPEFTQLDLEMSFVEEEDIRNLIEGMFIKLVEEIYPEKKIQTIPFPRMTYREAIDKYNTDRPDLRENKDDKNLLAFLWIIDFPFFEKTKDGKWTFTHNPFSRVKKEHESWLLESKNISDILTTQYDIVLNGLEVGGGSLRNYKSHLLRKVFEIMGFDEKRIEDNFGHMLKSFDYGTPPHGGIAPGLDRLLMILENEPNIREVIAFPKTGDGRDPMMQAPSEVGLDQLLELGISLKNKK